MNLANDTVILMLEHCIIDTDSHFRFGERGETLVSLVDISGDNWLILVCSEIYAAFKN